MNTARLLATLVLALGVGCAGSGATDQPGDDDGDKNDTICRQGTLGIDTDQEPIELVREGDKASYSGSLTVDLFSETRMDVDTPMLRLQPGADSLVAITVDTPFSDLFTHLKFGMRVRPVGTTSWQEIELPTSVNGKESYDIFWFDYVELDFAGEQMALTTERLCSGLDEEAVVPFQGFAGREFELELYAFPFSGWGSLEGDYDFSLQVEWLR